MTTKFHSRSMILIVDNSSSDKIMVGALLNNKLVQTFFVSRRGLVAAIEIFLKRKSLAQRELTGILVRTGLGSFTATRVATTVANALGLAWSLPVAVAAEGEDWQIAARRLDDKCRQYAHPLYSAPAHIGGRQLAR